MRRACRTTGTTSESANCGSFGLLSARSIYVNLIAQRVRTAISHRSLALGQSFVERQFRVTTQGVERLLESVRRGEKVQPSVEGLEELSAGLEELKVMAEHLREQNQEVLAARRDL